MKNTNLGKNPLAARRSKAGTNPLARGTMNKGKNRMAIPWETNHLVFRNYEEGYPMVEKLMREVSAVLAEDAPQVTCEVR